MKRVRAGFHLQVDQRRRLWVMLVAGLTGVLTVLGLMHERLQMLLTLHEEMTQLASRLEAQQQAVASQRPVPAQPPQANVDWPDLVESADVWSWLQQQMQVHRLQVQTLRLEPAVTKNGLPELPVSLRLQGRWPDWIRFARALDQHAPWWVVDRWQLVPSDPGAANVRFELQARLGLRPPGWRNAPLATPIWANALPRSDAGALAGADPFASIASTPGLEASREATAPRSPDPRQWPLREWRLLGVWQQGGKAHAVLGSPAGHLAVTQGQGLGQEGYRVRRVGDDAVWLQALGASEPELHWALQGGGR